MNNERFTAYYKAQNIIPDEDWDHFMNALRLPLPTTFRVAGSRETAHVLNNAIEETYVPLLSGAEFEGEQVPPPSQLPWYPEGLAWQFNVSKKVLRKSVEFKKFHSFLVFETEVGNISRQEAVSMIPPLLLDVQPYHKVIDMCAAPGSKTAQLLEALHAQDTATSTSTPPGLLIANDSDGKRAHLLIHQSARLPSPAFMVTNLDASIYPILRLPNTESEIHRVKKTSNQLLFDRILCDVPCSGDGTLRKNVGIWKRWQPMDGNGLHSLQVRILQRAMRMLEDDGRIVYSTCSLNPVENEAVIAAALNSNPGKFSFELVDVSDQLPQLLRRPGISAWTPTVDRSINTTFRTWDDFVQSLPESKRLESKISESHWPPSNAESLRLQRCLRIYPHLQDTGGFFVAVLQKKQSCDVGLSTQISTKREAEEFINHAPETKKAKLESEEVNPHNPVISDIEDVLSSVTAPASVGKETKKLSTERVLDEKAKSSGGSNKDSPHDSSFKEMPYTFLTPDDTTLQSCIAQLSFTSEFPSSNVLVRNPTGEAARSLYLTNDLVKEVVRSNDYTRMRLLTCGTKVVTKQEAGKGMDAQFRILGEGLPAVLPYASPGLILTTELATLKILLETYYPLCTGFAEPFRSAIEAKNTGSHIVRFPAGSSSEATNLSHDLVLPLWKSNVSVSLMIDKKAKSALSLRLFGEDITSAAREAAQKKTLLAEKLPLNDHQMEEDLSQNE
ncbi:S-adenosyl-L-methionine-dependent methyltransferase [Hygrophoropsis aurantiaca]|uniref:S-adenosyl-L-methionine-dependent methyltransferase n=1 Tax=Hygrophoropsis aurantiaca TaxID=72124 RepID=A0ACB7ZVT1_9AGAM|nr:S-adenosyl-L-methionine-dependent methyltransferase [Hygrophoropsis aurantiaca]